MTRQLLFTAFAVLVALVVTSCGSTNEPTRYPDTLVGFWANTPDAEGQWYGLDVVDVTSANLITYEGAEEIQTEAFQLTYTASNGKGTLVGDGRSPKIQVINDTTLTILMASGEVTFTKANKPIETFSLTGYWKEETTSGSARHLLFYPNDEEEGTIATLIMEDDGILDGSMMHVIAFDKEALTGQITYIGESTKSFDIAAIDMNQLRFKFGGEKTLTKQPRTAVAPKNLVGSWATEANAGIMGMKMTITVDENGDCQIHYTKESLSGSQDGTATGKVYYCPRAGMGVLVPVEYNTDDEFSQLFDGFECGIFTAISSTQIGVSMAVIGIEDELIFTKQ